MFQILYSQEGRKFVYSAATKTDRDAFVTILSRADIDYTIMDVDSNPKYQVAYVAFSLDDAALIATGKKRPYAFADPDEYAAAKGLVEVQCEDGRTKVVYVVGTAKKTVPEIQTIATNLGRKKLSRVIRKIA